MNEEELALLISHSTVLADEDIEELKDSDVIREFEGISLKAIFEGKETFQQLDKLIKTTNLFFKYDIDLYPQLLDFLVKEYVLKLQHNSITVEGLISPVIEDIKSVVDNLPLYNYVFNGDRSTELLSSSEQLFEEKAFTPEEKGCLAWRSLQLLLSKIPSRRWMSLGRMCV
jgi:hypothetical protein